MCGKFLSCFLELPLVYMMALVIVLIHVSFCHLILMSCICYIIFQVKDVKGLSIDLLVPGMMVNARVHSTLENGIMLSFLTYFTGTVSLYLLYFVDYIMDTSIWMVKSNFSEGCRHVCSFTYFLQVDIFHLQNCLPNATWKNDYYENKKVFSFLCENSPLFFFFFQIVTGFHDFPIFFLLNFSCLLTVIYVLSLSFCKR